MPATRPEPRRLPVGETPGAKTVHLMLDRREGAGNPEGYELTVGGGRIAIRAPSAQGLFHGVQTLRQLLPPAAGEVTLLGPAAELERAEVDELGLFTLACSASGPIRLRCRTSRVVLTDWFTC